MTDVTTPPPIIPGPPQEDPTSQWAPVGQPPPVYQPPYAPPMQGYQPSGTPDVVKKTAVGTVTVIVVLVAVFCVLPMIACGFMAALGSMSAPRP